MLVKKDPWNLVEDFYDPGTEFIYFENFEELKDIIQDVSTNFEKYQDIVEAAYLKSTEYTAEKIYRYIQTDNQSLITWRNKHA